MSAMRRENAEVPVKNAVEASRLCGSHGDTLWYDITTDSAVVDWLTSSDERSHNPYLLLISGNIGPMTPEELEHEIFREVSTRGREDGLIAYLMGGSGPDLSAFDSLSALADHLHSAYPLFTHEQILSAVSDVSSLWQAVRRDEGF